MPHTSHTATTRQRPALLKFYGGPRDGHKQEAELDPTQLPVHLHYKQAEGDKLTTYVYYCSRIEEYNDGRFILYFVYTPV